jgi:hypothetical protein
MIQSSALLAYAKTAAWILFMPWSAARHVAIPDRLACAIRWAAIHVIAAAGAATFCCNDYEFSMWIWHVAVPDPYFHPAYFMSQDPPGSRATVWFAQTFMAWLVLFASIPALGCALALVIPHHRAWQRCAAKWSCYVTIVLAPVVTLWYAWYRLYPVVYRMPGPMTIFDSGPAPDLAPGVAGTAFAVYWGLGACSLVYRRSIPFIARLRTPRRLPRRWPIKTAIRHAGGAVGCLMLRAAPYTGLFVGAWWVLRHGVFPAGPLEALR